MSTYVTNRNSVFALHYHLILTVKYRRKVIDDSINDRLKEIAEYIARNHQCTIDEWNHDVDHVHVLMSTTPSTSLVKFINSYKSASSRLIKKEFPQIKQHLYKDAFWSGSYFLASTGGVTLDILKTYVESQGEN